MPILLTARLQMIAELVPQCRCAADIGCDHGRLAVYIIQNNLAGQVIASDISSNSVAKAAKLAKLCHVEDRIDFRIGDGLTVLEPGEAQTVIVSGMGGAEIVRILNRGIARDFVIQPQNNVNQARKNLTENGFMITDERLCLDRGRFYEIIKLEKGEQILSEQQCEFGPILIQRNEPLLHRYIERKIVLTEDSLRELEGKYTPKALRDGEMLDKKLNQCREMLKCLR